MRVSYLEIYNEEVRDLLGKDQAARLEVSLLLYTLHFSAFLLFMHALYTCLFYIAVVNKGFWIAGQGETRCWGVCEGPVCIQCQ